MAIVSIHSSVFQIYGEGLDLRLNHYENGVVYISKSSENTNSRMEKITTLVKQQIHLQQKRIDIVDLEINPEEDIETSTFLPSLKPFVALFRYFLIKI